MDYAMMISRIYKDYVPVEVMNTMLQIAQEYPVSIGASYNEYTFIEFAINGVGAVRLTFRDHKQVTYTATYSRRHGSLKVVTSRVSVPLDLIEVDMGDYIFSTIMLGLKSYKRFHPTGLSAAPISVNDFKDYMIPARLVAKMLDTIGIDDCIEILAPANDTSIVSLTKSMAADEHYHFIESRLNCRETNVYTYHVGSYVTTSRPADNVPEQWVHVEAVKRMLQEYKLMLASKQSEVLEASAEHLTVNVNVTVE